MSSKRFNQKFNIVANNIHKYRTLRNYSQPDICRELSLIGVTLYINDIYKIEHGKRCVRDYELFALAKVLRVSLDQLFENTEDNFSLN